MAAHPQVSLSDARDMVDYILSLNDAKKASQPIKAAYETAAHKGKKDGAYIIQATYTDKGGKLIGPLSNSESFALRSSKVKAVSFDDSKSTSKFNVEALGGEIVIATEDGAYFGFKNIDLTGIKGLTIGAFSQKGQSVGGKFEVRSGSPNGALLAEAEVSESNMMPLKVSVNTTGQQNLYFVFKNPKAEGKPLFGVSSIDFLNK
jgi:cytochrome c